jgi:predicted permease
VGVLPAEAAFPDAIELWVPLAGDPGQTYQSYAYNGIGRLRPGVSIEAAARDLIRAHAPVWQDHDREKAVSPFLRPLRDEFVRDFTAVASMLSAAVGLLLIVACANVASLMLARALARRHEMGVRLALGAGRARLLRQLLVEHAILAAAGGVIGLGLGQVALRGIVAALPDELPRWAAFQVDARVIAFAVGVVVVTVILFGWAPALHAVRGDLRAAINDAGARSSGSPRGRRTLRLLVGGEFALAALLLVCGGLLFSAFNRVRQVDPGFRPDHVLAFSLSLPEAVYPKDEQKVAFWDSIVGRLDALPGVESAGVVSCAPLGCHWGNFFEAEGQAPRSGAREDPVVLYRPASAGYFRTMGIHLRSGRVFDDRDGRNRLAQTVIVNETFARAFWPRGTSPVGQRIKLRGKENPWMTVVGVVGDVKHYGLELPMRPGVYVPMPIDPSPTLTVAVRTKVDPHAAVAMVRGAVRGLDPDLPMFQIRTMEEALQRSLSVRVAYSSLAGVFSMLALVLALAGTYGVTSYLVTQRTRELGIRIALGARTPDIVRSVVSRGLVAVGGGVAAGLVVSLAAVKLLSTLLFGVGRDAAVIGGVAFLLLATALLANLIPARRAARVDPVRSLRTE